MEVEDGRDVMNDWKRSVSMGIYILWNEVWESRVGRLVGLSCARTSLKTPFEGYLSVSVKDLSFGHRWTMMPFRS